MGAHPSRLPATPTWKVDYFVYLRQEREEMEKLHGWLWSIVKRTKDMKLATPRFRHWSSVTTEDFTSYEFDPILGGNFHIFLKI